MFEVKKEAGIHKGNIADVNEVKQPMRIFLPNVAAAAAIHVPVDGNHCKSFARIPTPLPSPISPAPPLRLQSSTNYVFCSMTL